MHVLWSMDLWFQKVFRNVISNSNRNLHRTVILPVCWILWIRIVESLNWILWIRIVESLNWILWISIYWLYLIFLWIESSELVLLKGSSLNQSFESIILPIQSQIDYWLSFESIIWISNTPTTGSNWFFRYWVSTIELIIFWILWIDCWILKLHEFNSLNWFPNISYWISIWILVFYA